MGLVDYGSDDSSEEEQPTPGPASQPGAVKVKERTIAGGLVVRSAKAGTILPACTRPKIYLPPVSQAVHTKNNLEEEGVGSGLSFMPAPKHAPKKAPEQPTKPLMQSEQVEEDDDDDDAEFSMFGAALAPVVEYVHEDAPSLGPSLPPEMMQQPQHAAPQPVAPQEQHAASFDYVDWVDDKHAKKRLNPNRRQAMPDASQMIEIKGVDLSDTSKWSDEFKEHHRQVAQSRINADKVEAMVYNKEGGTMTMCTGASRVAKRKHQIHALALQAKQKEAELNSRVGKHQKSKAQTYGRYGW